MRVQRDALEAHWGCCGVHWGPSGGAVGRTGGPVGAQWGALGPSWDAVGCTGGPVEAQWGAFLANFYTRFIKSANFRNCKLVDDLSLNMQSFQTNM